MVKSVHEQHGVLAFAPRLFHQTKTQMTCSASDSRQVHDVGLLVKYEGNHLEQVQWQFTPTETLIALQTPTAMSCTALHERRSGSPPRDSQVGLLGKHVVIYLVQVQWQFTPTETLIALQTSSAVNSTAQ